MENKVEIDFNILKNLIKIIERYEREMEIMKAKLDEKQKHKETLQYFLDTIDFD